MTKFNSIVDRALSRLGLWSADGSDVERKVGRARGGGEVST